VKEQNRDDKRKLGFFTASAIIVGAMIGSGIFMVPQGLAELSTPMIAVLAMLITGVGTIFLAISFSRLGRNDDVRESPLVYTKQAFGDLPAFWMGWSYWCGCWIANGAIILAGLSYASYFFPVLAGNSVQRCIASIVIIWIYTGISILGMRETGVVNMILTIAKLLPLLVFAIIAALHFDPVNLRTVSSASVEGISTLPVAMAYILWSFLGFEGAAVNAVGVSDHRRLGIITVVSTFFVVCVYLILVILSAGAVPQSELVNSASPFADIIFSTTGAYWAGGAIALGGTVSAIGCAGPWILSGGTLACTMSENELLPEVFSRMSKRGTPACALLINGVLMTIIMLLAWLTQEGSLYNFFVMLATLSFLVFYVFGAASEIMLAGKKIKPFSVKSFIKNSIISLIALVYAIYTIYGSGADYVFYGFLLMLLGLPFYLYIRLKSIHAAET